jgi:adenylosuccinate synthase
MITTPFDILKNIKLDSLNLHGTVGVGFGTTIKRNEDFFHLYARDLQYPKIRDIKLKLLQEKYYEYISLANSKTQKIIDDFKLACDDLVSRFDIVNTIYDIYLLGSSIPTDYFDLIFEGGQGIMLDMDYGFFPHVTRSNTTSKNAIEIINKLGITINERNVDTYYITRAYQTRHGNGPMTNEGMDISYIKDNPLETNVNDGWQGVFRKSILDIGLLRYAFDCDNYNNPKSRKNVVVTCLDQVPDKVPVTGIGGGKLITVDATAIGSCIGIPKQFSSYSDKGID